jgi:hypothetical protein
MTALLLREARVLSRRGAWPAALLMHAAASGLFVTVWGRTGGVPLWEASLLQQLAAFDRLIAAAVLTWLATYVLADDEGGMRSASDWSALSGRPVRIVFLARVAAAAAMSIVFVVTAAPALAAAGELSAATPGVVAAQLAAALGFACFCLGAAAIAAAAIRDRVGVWCTAMSLSLFAAFAVRALETTLMRGIIPALAGLILALIAPGILETRRLHDGR